MHSSRRLAAFGRNRLAWPGLAITAFVAGSILGPAAVSAVPKAQDVFVTNDSASPVPVSGTVNATVSGTVNVGNLPATQPVSGTVDVGNLPATQPVSGTVGISSMPTPENVSGGTTQSGNTAPGVFQSLTLTNAIDVTAVMFHSTDTAELNISSAAVANGYRLISAGDATVTQSFYNPIHAVTFIVSCQGATVCHWEFSVAGI